MEDKIGSHPRHCPQCSRLGGTFCFSCLSDLLKGFQLTTDMFMFQLVQDIDGGSMHEGFFRGAAGGWGASQEVVV